MSRRIQIGLFACGALVVASAAVLAPTAGCTVLTHDAPLDDAGVYDGAADAPSNACPACVADPCVGAWALCLTDPSCRAVRACDNPFAESSGAVASCVCALGAIDGGSDAGTPGLAAYQAFASCNDARTCTACALTCSGICSGGGRRTTFTGSCSDAGADAGADADTDAGADAAPPVTADGCTGCISGKCADPKKPCAVGTECAAYLGCVYACQAEACANDCGQEHATGKAAAAALSNCAHAACSAACGL